MKMVSVRMVGVRVVGGYEGCDERGGYKGGGWCEGGDPAVCKALHSHFQPPFFWFFPSHIALRVACSLHLPLSEQ